MNNDKPLKSETPILGTDQTMLDFWQWGFSKILTNNLRGIFAEFLIGTALGCLNVEWDAYDLVYKGMKIEVKSSAYIQAWHKEKYSNISFSIGAKKEYDYTTNKYNPTVKRNADIYVFCLLKEKNLELIEPLNTAQWEFYLALTKDLDIHFPNQKTISLNSLKKIAQRSTYEELKKTIEGLL
ncbi:hypothetical protein QRD90_21110 [Peribacillus frigoritolerans]|uniref:hypothetical protein n=1 Tax=Peribacillus frigoritolerans TaxID=450367 RepID=UPI002570D5B3|nr:hypothetical protein [Peribacillus frigoritolerans]WJE46680.1 hypothetical protein QRD90_21110 [Peribacillus frigoritolerans]